MTISPELWALLVAEDLDELLRARRNIESIDTEDTEVLREVIVHWENPQAVSNLLFHPDLIPEDLRLDALVKGLTEHQVVYYRLAAAVGFDKIDPASIFPQQRDLIVEQLHLQALPFR